MNHNRTDYQYAIQGTWIYLLGYGMILFCPFIASTTWGIPNAFITGIRFLGYVLLTIHIFKRRRIRRNTFYLGLIMIVISLLSVINGGYSVLLDYAICCVFAIDVEFSKIVRVFIIECLILTFVTTIAASLGLIENYIYYRRETGDIRLSLGFIFPTNFAAHIFFVLVGITYICYEKFNWKFIILYGIIAYVMYEITNSRGPCTMMIAMAVIINVYRFFSRRGINIIPKWLLKYSTIICATITFVLIDFYNPYSQVWKTINAITTNRLAYAKQIMKNNSITLLGQYIEQRGDGNGGRLAGEAYTYIDLSFQRILLMYGILLFGFILIYSVLIYKKSYKSNNMTIPILLLIVAFYSLTAQHYFDFSYNFILLSYFAVIPSHNVVNDSFQSGTS